MSSTTNTEMSSTTNTGEFDYQHWGLPSRQQTHAKVSKWNIIKATGWNDRQGLFHLLKSCVLWRIVRQQVGRVETALLQTNLTQHCTANGCLSYVINWWRPTLGGFWNVCFSCISWNSVHFRPYSKLHCGISIMSSGSDLTIPEKILGPASGQKWGEPSQSHLQLWFAVKTLLFELACFRITVAARG